MNKLKALYEKRNEAIEAMKALVAKATEETRAMTDEENTNFAELKNTIDGIDKTITAEEESRAFEPKQKEEKKEETRSAETIVNSYIRGEELRAGEMSTTANGNIIPEELSTDIIKKLYERCDILNLVSKIQATGIFKQIVENTKVSAGWVDELATVTAVQPNFSIVEIGHHKLGALVKLSLEILNQTEINVTAIAVEQMLDDFANKAEQALLAGSGTNQPEGLNKKGETVTLASATALTADELVDIYHSLQAPFLADAKWIMSRKTLGAIRKLKGTDGQYLFQQDMTNAYVGYILGKPVLVSEFMEEMGTAGKSPILLGDYKRAYKANINPNQFIQVLNEKYIDQGAKGVIGFMFIDGKVVNEKAYVRVVTP